MFKTRDRNTDRKIRHARVRKKISGTPEMPRLCVYRSLSNIYVQVIDDVAGKTLVSCSTLDPQVKGQLAELDKKGAAKLVGKTVAELELAIVGFGGEAQAAVDAVTGATLVDTLGYLQGLLAAAKAAK